MENPTPFRKTEYVTLVSQSADGETTLYEHWPVSQTDYAAMLASATLLPVRVTVPLGRPMTHDELLMASSEFHWNWLDEPADGLVFSAFHAGGQWPQVVIRYFDETHAFLIAGTDADKVSRVKAQAEKF